MNKKTVKDLLARREAIKVRFNEIADLLVKEQREMNQAEQEEQAALEREMRVIDLHLLAAGNTVTAPDTTVSREAQMDTFLREARQGGKDTEIVLQREAIKTTATNVDATFPLTVEELMLPLEEGLIMNLVGLKTQTGLQGTYIIPGIGAVEAEVKGEAEELADKAITFSKLQPQPERVGITISISNQLINRSAGVAYEAIKTQLAAGVQRLLNKRMFATAGAYTDKLVGPFFELAKDAGVSASDVKTLAQKKAAKKINFAGAVPTYKELILMRTIPALKGVAPLNPAYVMDAAVAGELAGTPKDQGSGRMIIENGMIDGIPVFITNYIDAADNCNVGFGYFGYEGFGQFGEMRLIVDPYTQAKKDCIQITLNGEWSMTALRSEAFTLGKCAAK
jgi:HK97 family phage major capsid protein